MIDWKQSSDNSYCRELTCVWELGYMSYVFVKETGKLEITILNKNDDVVKNIKKTPRIPINDLLWLMNGE